MQYNKDLEWEDMTNQQVNLCEELALNFNIDVIFAPIIKSGKAYIMIAAGSFSNLKALEKKLGFKYISKFTSYWGKKKADICFNV